MFLLTFQLTLTDTWSISRALDCRQRALKGSARSNYTDPPPKKRKERAPACGRADAWFADEVTQNRCGLQTYQDTPANPWLFCNIWFLQISAREPIFCNLFFKWSLLVLVLIKLRQSWYKNSYCSSLLLHYKMNNNNIIKLAPRGIKWRETK